MEYIETHDYDNKKVLVIIMFISIDRLITMLEHKRDGFFLVLFHIISTHRIKVTKQSKLTIHVHNYLN